MSRRAASLAFFLLSFALLGACGIDTAPDGARRTPPGDGPRVVFDLMRRPLPEIPQPNDIATFADPTSRTGRRINVSLVAPTRLESQARSDFGSLEGWGTFASLTVAFERDPRTPETEAAIDLADVAARTRTWDPSDDPFYVIDLTTGIPVILDTGKRNFPLTVVDPNAYWPNDPRAKADNILYESVEEGAGLGQSAYRPELDTDFDGVLDHPNVITRTGADARVEDVIDWYERESDTLVLRPVVPLEEMHEYAVVLTDRLKSASGAPIRSPFEFVHHVAQREEAERVRAILSDGSKAKQAYYGDVAGTGLDHVAFTWSFTTQPVFDDMRLLRNGLHGRGPFARLAHDFPPTARAFRAAGLALQESDEAPGGVDADPRCATVKKTPYIVRLADSQKTLFELLDRLSSVLGVRGEELRTLKDSLDSIDHIVIGSFESPYFLGDPEHEDPDGRFELNFKTGEGRVARDTVQFWLTVPKPTAAAHAPFPVTTWSHGSSNNDAEVLIRAGYFAKQGLAMMAINMPGHGLVIDEGLQTFAGSLLRGVCLTPFVTALAAGRARDLNGDGVADSGGLLWTAHVFHSRDNIRQSVIDQLQATRVLRSWDGALRSDQDYNGDGVADLAGDFDGDGVVDVGGPSVPITTSGNSYGGVVAMIHGAVDPNVAASAPISGGGGLIDLTARSALVPDLVIEQSMTPLIVAVPASTVGKRNDVPQTQCSGDQRSLRFVVNDLTSSREIEIACLSPAELDAGKTVVLENLRNHERRCARTTEDGRLRIPIPANVDDRLDLQIYDAPDVVASYKGCEVAAGAPIGRRISTFEQPFVEAAVVGDGTRTCEAAVAASGVEQDKGCAQFRDRFFPVGSPLVAPQEGLGLLRQSPELRRLFMLSQMGVEGGDPMNFAPYFALRPAPGVDGEPMPPRPIVHFGTAGDPFVPSAAGYAFARALGALPFLPTGFVYTHPEWAAYATPRDLQTALGDKTPNDVLIETWTLEGVARMGRSSGGPVCKPNYVESDVCTSPPSTRACKRAVFDADWLSEGANLWDAPHPAVPLRLARSAEVAIVDADSLTRAWEPRLHGAPLSPDNAGYRAPTPLLGQINAWIQPGGTHVFINPDPCKAFDDVLYYDGLLVHFLASGGRDLAFLSHPGSHRCLEKGDCPFL